MSDNVLAGWSVLTEWPRLRLGHSVRTDRQLVHYPIHKTQGPGMAPNIENMQRTRQSVQIQYSQLDGVCHPVSFYRVKITSSVFTTWTPTSNPSKLNPTLPTVGSTFSGYVRQETHQPTAKKSHFPDIGIQRSAFPERTPLFTSNTFWSYAPATRQNEKKKTQAPDVKHSEIKQQVMGLAHSSERPDVRKAKPNVSFFF